MPCYQYQWIPIGNAPICSPVSNVIIGGMQSSIFGSDVFDLEVPRSLSSGGKDKFDGDTLKLSNIADPAKKFLSSNQQSKQTNLQDKLG